MKYSDEGDFAISRLFEEIQELKKRVDLLSTHEMAAGPATQIKETGGPDILNIGAIPDPSLLVRVNNEIIGAGEDDLRSFLRIMTVARTGSANYSGVEKNKGTYTVNVITEFGYPSGCYAVGLQIIAYWNTPSINNQIGFRRISSANPTFSLFDLGAGGNVIPFGIVDLYNNTFHMEIEYANTQYLEIIGTCYWR